MVVTMACSDRDETHWICLGCHAALPVNEFERRFGEEVAIYCDCCDHMYICHKCYNETPKYDYWRPRFGPSHAVRNVVERVDRLTRYLRSIIAPAPHITYRLSY